MKQALIFWFTGLSGSGKTTVATGVKPLLETDGYSVLVLDGDTVRAQLHSRLGFTEQDIKENNALIADLCRTYRDDYDVILVAIISPYASTRKQARNSLGKGFYEIYFSADLETLIKRDVKGLYSRAERNEIPNLIGYSPGTVYEEPRIPDFTVDSVKISSEISINGLYKFITEQLSGYDGK